MIGQQYYAVSDLYELYQMKAVLTFMNMGSVMFGMAGAGAVSAGASLATTLMQAVLKPVEALLNDRTDFIQKRIGEELVNLILVVGAETMAERRLAYDLKNSMVWLRDNPLEDPPIDLTLLSFQAPDLRLTADEYSGEGTAIVVVRNDSQLTVEVGAAINILVQGETAVTRSGDPISLTPGEEGTLSISYKLPKSIPVAPGGYDGLIYIQATHPESLTTRTIGPLYVHFKAGTPEDLALLNRQNVSYLLGGKIVADDEHSTSFQIDTGTERARFILAGTESAGLRIKVTDALGRSVGHSANEVPGATIVSPTAGLVVVEIPGPEGRFTAAVSAPEEARDAEYTLAVHTVPTQSAMLRGLTDRVAVETYASSSTARVTVQEFSRQRGVNQLAISISDLVGEGGLVQSTSIAVTVEDAAIGPGGVANFAVDIPLSAGLPDGLYSGVATVSGRDAQDGAPVQTSVEVLALVDRTPPAVPVLEPLAATTSEPKVTVTGSVPETSMIRVFLDGQQVATLGRIGGGGFSVNVTAGDGRHAVHAIAEDAAGNRSDSSEELVFTSTADIAPPVVSMDVVPATGAGHRVSLVASDEQGGSGVASIFYVRPEDTAFQTYAQPFTVQTGTTVLFYAADAAGNFSPAQSRVVAAGTGVLAAVVTDRELVVAEIGAPVVLEAIALDAVGNVLTDVDYVWSLTDGAAGSILPLEGGTAQLTVARGGDFPGLVRVQVTRGPVTVAGDVDVAVPSANEGLISGHVLLEGPERSLWRGGPSWRHRNDDP